MAGTVKPVLHSFFLSSATWRVRIALAYKGIAYNYRSVDIFKQQNKTEKYLALNPTGQVPTLEIDGLTLGQSVAMMEYLEETRPEPWLMPADPASRATVRCLVELVNAGIQPIQNPPVMKYVTDMTGDSRQGAALGKHFTAKGLGAVEKYVVQTAGTYCVGDRVTLADLCLVPQAYHAKLRHKVDMTEFPAVCRVVENCEKLECFQQASPIHQPDYDQKFIDKFK